MKKKISCQTCRFTGVVAVLVVSLTLLRANAEPSTQVAGAAGAKPARTQSKLAMQNVNSTYLRDVLPVLMGKCVRCHNPENRLLPNWLDYKTAFADRAEMKRRVWDSWKGKYYKQPMPAGNSPECLAITEEERATIREWVDEGGALGEPPRANVPQTKPERFEQGKHLFGVICTPCHQSNGLGIPDKFPPLAGSDFLNADKKRAIKVLLHGRQGQIVVNGQNFNNSMPVFPLSDADIASALTYVYSSFGNSGKDVTAADVAAARAEKEDEIPASAREVAHAEQKSDFE